MTSVPQNGALTHMEIGGRAERSLSPGPSEQVCLVSRLETQDTLQEDAETFLSPLPLPHAREFLAAVAQRACASRDKRPKRPPSSYRHSAFPEAGLVSNHDHPRPFGRSTRPIGDVLHGWSYGFPAGVPLLLVGKK